jgi:fucose 4-O-acetylase-like acetyltransferase
MNSTINNKKRIEWIDIAKGITIILMIIGHTVEFGSEVRNFIFSFHMPLFFILSGFTAKSVLTWGELKIQVIKNAKRLLLPCIITQCISWSFYFFVQDQKSLFEIINMLPSLMKQLFWASGVQIGDIPALGALWFLVVCFYAKLIFDLVVLSFESKYTGIIYSFCAIFGGYFLSSNRWLPQSFDVVFVAVFFIYIG